VAERDRLDVDSVVNQPDTGDWRDWTRRGPSDSDRLRVNKKGREILYFVRPPPSESDASVSELRAELCRTLQVRPERVSFSAGPFHWGPNFEEDGLGLYASYFDADLEIDVDYMKTVRGAALLDVIENPVPSGST